LRQRSGLDEQAPKALSENPAVLTGKKAKSKDTRHVQAGYVKSSVTRFFRLIRGHKHTSHGRNTVLKFPIQKMPKEFSNRFWE